MVEVDLFNSPCVRITDLSIENQPFTGTSITVVLDIFPKDIEMLEIYYDALRQKMEKL